MHRLKQNPDPADARQSKLPVWVLVASIVVLFCLVFSQTWFNLTFLRPGTTQQTLIFTALSFLISLLFVALLSILLSQLVRLYTRRQMMGSRFQTKMVVGALFLSFVPVLFLFFFAYGLMNRSIDKWFSYPAEQLRQDSSELASLLTDYATENASAEATAIAASPETERAYQTGQYDGLLAEIMRDSANLQGGFAIALKRDQEIKGFRAPQPWQKLKDLLPSPHAASAPIARINGTDYVIGEAPEGADGRIVVGLPLPSSLNALMTRIGENQRRYSELSNNKKQVRLVFVKLLSLLTLLTLFLATWISLYISKFVTRSVSALAEAMEEISQGHFSYRVELDTSDELGELVTSFNSMAADLESSRAQLDASGRQLEEARQAQQERRRQLEAVLENIPSGVLSLDTTYRISDFNRAFANMFARNTVELHTDEQSRVLELSEFFDKDLVLDLRRLLRKSDRMGVTAGQFEIAGHGALLDVAVTAASLNSGNQRLGYVVVFEDFTELLKAQKQAAWREVARRVAHEIKNPLTPIALSAERIRKHIERPPVRNSQSLAIIRTCIETITGSVETVRNLVNDFSALAQFPASQPRPADFNAIVESALALFHGRLNGIQIHLKLAANLPLVMADPESMKRAVANLIDNAAEAMNESLYREMELSTSVVEGRDLVELVIADTGHGVTQDMKDRLFVPYFSTKQRGSGLGLAIVSKILQEHQGSVRVEENQPVGARFILELPLAAEVAATAPVVNEASS